MQNIDYVTLKEDVGNQPNYSNKSQLSPEEEAEITANNQGTLEATLAGLNRNSKFTEATIFLQGIYGYIEDAETGENITLSLTPYEISPRLGDPRIFTFNSPDKSERIAGTVGNRLQAARVVTNFMQEVLNPADESNRNGDKRFGSKDNRVGSLSRNLNSNGGQSDRSALIHIVPDVSETGGTIPIKYKKYIDGKLSEDNGLAYVPVNFNFTSSKYTLTIKEFLLNSINESDEEIYSLEKMFDGSVFRTFGSRPKIVNFTGGLTNFDDDVIGYSDDVLDVLKWNGGEAVPEIPTPTKGSQRDVFMSYYKNFLKGTKCLDYKMKTYLYYNWRILEGYFINFHITTSGENDNVVMFNASMVIKEDRSAFEVGRGLGVGLTSSSIGKNFGNIVDGNDPLKDTVFSNKVNYRSAYRKFAIENSLQNLNDVVQKLKTTVKETDHTSYDSSNASDVADSRILEVFDETNTSDKTFVIEFITSLNNAIGNYDESDSKAIGFDDPGFNEAVYTKFISNKNIKFTDLMNYLINYTPGKIWYFQAKPNTVVDVNAINQRAMTNLKANYDLVSGASYKPYGDINYLINESVIKLIFLSGSYLNNKLVK